MRIRLLAECIGAHVHGRKGDIAEVPDELAAGMISTGHAEAAEPSEPLGAAPASRRQKAVAKPRATR